MGPGLVLDSLTNRNFQIELLLPGVCGDGNLDVGEECDDGNLVNGDGCDDACQLEGVPDVGEIVVTEIHANPVGIAPGAYVPVDWFEITNVSAGNLELNGCVARDDGGFNEVVFNTPLTIAPGQFLTVASNANAGFTPDFVDINLILVENATDGFTISCFGTDVDTVAWDGVTFPTPAGSSMMLDITALSATANDDPTNWCAASVPDPGYTTGDNGNPGVLNPLCPVVVCGDGSVDFPETCDDGNLVNGDGCDDTCQIEFANVEVITGCDPTYCVLAAAAGPNGGDLCTCTIDPANHPMVDDAEGGCFTGSVGNVLIFEMDLTAMGYSQYAVDTCQIAGDDYAVAVFDADPAAGGVEVECDEDADFITFCAQITTAGGTGFPALPTAAPATGQAWIAIDEWNLNQIWDQTTPRTFEIELIP